MIQPVAHIISILRLDFICFISFCPICHTTTPKAASHLVMAVMETILALILVIQGAALHIQLAKAAMVTAVVEITAPTMTQVAAA
jgi:hypothetical protein